MRISKRGYALRVVSIAVVLMLGLGAAAYAAGPFGGPNRFLGDFLPLPRTIAIAVALLMAAVAIRELRILVRYASVQALGPILHRRKVLFVGVNPKTLEVHESFRGTETDVIGFIDDPSRAAPDLPDPYLGGFESFESVLRTEVVDAVLVGLPLRSHYDVINRVLQICETHGITAHYLLNMVSTTKSYAKICVGEDAATLALHTAPIDGIDLALKHVIDRVGAFVLLLLTAPIMLFAALLIKLEDGGPVFFTQERVGYNKRLFGVFKLRTMVVDAEAKMAALEHLNERDGAAFKLKNDPRVSRVGRVLRKYSIDELPQLFNVLMGQMSLVGPRPISMRDYGLMPMDWQRRRFSMRPGLTCTWQVSGRHETTFESWMKMDLQYIDRWSLYEDVKILVMTIPAVLRGRGV
jgi:exopolysaccharide biosynthesis polyprenyl glycosylphosphotransferase